MLDFLLLKLQLLQKASQYLYELWLLDSICLVQGSATVEVHSSDDEIVPSFQESFVDALAQATENIQIANQGRKNPSL